MKYSNGSKLIVKTHPSAPSTMLTELSLPSICVQRCYTFLTTTEREKSTRQTPKIRRTQLASVHLRRFPFSGQEREREKKHRRKSFHFRLNNATSFERDRMRKKHPEKGAHSARPPKYEWKPPRRAGLLRRDT